MAIREKFQELFGSAPEVVAQAPGRVNLIGEHIDYSDGFVLPFAISDVTTVAIDRRDDGKYTIVSMQRPQHKVVADSLTPLAGEMWARYVLGTIWSLGVEGGFNVLIDGKVPVGAGLSSSAALECSVAVAINELLNLGKSREDLARITQRAENDYVGMPCGIMDQSVSLMGHEGSALLLDCRDLSTKDIPFDVASAGLELLIIDTQAHHALVDGGYAERRASCEKAVEILGITSLRDISVDDYVARKAELDPVTFIRGFHAVTEMKRVIDTVAALAKDDFETVGRLLNESHRSLRDDYTVSCPELDEAVDTARAMGAIGARMVGGGFGGSAIALAKGSLIPTIKEGITQSFSARGFKAPRFFTSLPSEGAHVI